ncbi:isocitrate lyase/phosphoenolpyruvate mutase family protein [Saxibacter everestensis]|uniref:Isocitrate lyase/phosphoenolpyruvate mutase family protein n=1 Tax=Saxibacter everestensis TaxID=2909229 RepID=A0ABY8QXM9_9MICO|nr:isocitrate lyase/phosphoenolpyruvate mutase family protein [Brevibacteriaceae bacterium ZFBP1038]
MQEPTTQTIAKASQFAALHQNGPLVLPNAWDIASAVLVQDAGAAAIATTSAGVAWSLGVPDGNSLTREQAIEFAARLVAAVDVPVTVDIEAGYGETADQVATTVSMLAACGAIGCNIEDANGSTLRDVRDQSERIAAARSTADRSGIPFFINARIDTYLLNATSSSNLLAETAQETAVRAQAYVAAGADGIFVPGLTDLSALRILADSIPVPLNAMSGSGGPSVGQLSASGVRRVSVGMGLAQSAYAVARTAAAEMLDSGTFDSLGESVDYGQMNALLAEAHRR